jgi:hypothetical protein
MMAQVAETFSTFFLSDLKHDRLDKSPRKHAPLTSGSQTYLEVPILRNEAGAMRLLPCMALFCVMG